MSDAQHFTLAQEFLKNLQKGLAKQQQQAAKAEAALPKDQTPAPATAPAPAPAVAAPQPQSSGAMGRKVLRIISNLDAGVTAELVRRPPPEQEPVDPIRHRASSTRSLAASPGATRDDARSLMFILERLHPKDFGPMTRAEVTGKDGAPLSLVPSPATPEAAATLLREAFGGHARRALIEDETEGNDDG